MTEQQRFEEQQHASRSDSLKSAATQYGEQESRRSSAQNMNNHKITSFNANTKNRQMSQEQFIARSSMDFNSQTKEKSFESQSSGCAFCPNCGCHKGDVSNLRTKTHIIYSYDFTV